MAPNHKTGLTREQKVQKKHDYLALLKGHFEKYEQFLVVRVDNVSSAQFQQIRKALRGKCEFIMGKNTLIRRAIKDQLETHPQLEAVLPHIHGNVGIVFTDGDVVELRKSFDELRAPCPAKAGSIAPNDVIVPAGDTGLDPTQTSFIQALNIASKITKGQIEITSNTLLVKAGEKVGVSQAVLLQKLKINPFFYGAVIDIIYNNGVVFGVEALDISNDDLCRIFQEGVATATALSIGANVPTEQAVPHLIANAFRSILGFTKESGFTFPLAEQIFSNASAAAPAAQEEKPAEPEEEEEEGDFGFEGLF